MKRKTFQNEREPGLAESAVDEGAGHQAPISDELLAHVKWSCERLSKRGSRDTKMAVRDILALIARLESHEGVIAARRGAF